MVSRHSSTIEVVSFIHRHLSRRPAMSLGGLERLGSVRRAQAFVARCGAQIVSGGSQPAYDPQGDVIYMPNPCFYVLARLHMLKATYAICILHELVHFTSHASRLNRARHRQSFDEIYRREELIAELGSALLCHDLKITSTPTLPHAKYLNGYLRSLPNAGVELDIALAHANEGVGYLHALFRRG